MIAACGRASLWFGIACLVVVAVVCYLGLVLILRK